MEKVKNKIIRKWNFQIKLSNRFNEPKEKERGRQIRKENKDIEVGR